MITVLLAGCGGNNQQTQPVNQPGSEKIEVITTIFPLYDFTRNIGGDRVAVKNLVPPGSEPHSWEPTPGDMVNIKSAILFIYSGAGLETSIEKIVKSVNSPGLNIVDSSKGITLLAPGLDEHSQHQHHHSESADPHIWLDPVNAKTMVDNILAGLLKADPRNNDYYTANASAYKEKLDQLDQQYQSTLGSYNGKAFVTSHAAFGYLAHRYGIKQVAIRGLSPEAEPSPARMAEVVETVKDRGIKYIFFETLVSPKISETLARETGARTLVLNPIGGLTAEELARGKDYISIMEENLANLKISFEVK